MKEEINRFVSEALDRFKNDYELERATIRNVLSLNLDVLMNRAVDWFGQDTPREYRAVIQSFLALMATLMERDFDPAGALAERVYRRVDIITLCSLVARDFNTLFRADTVSVESDFESLETETDENGMFEALTHIVLSMVSFMDSGSRCSIKIEREEPNIRINLQFMDLLDSFPGVQKIQRVFYQYRVQDQSHYGIGIDTPVAVLKEMGARVQVGSFTSQSDLEVVILLPTLNFLETIGNLRDREVALDRRKSKVGEILLVVQDQVVEVVLREFLDQNGYTVTVMSSSEMETLESMEGFKSVIIDYACVREHFLDKKFFHFCARECQKGIVIFDSTRELEESEIQQEGLTFFVKPVEVEAIIHAIEERP
jgi:hypothetical protein